MNQTLKYMSHLLILFIKDVKCFEKVSIVPNHYALFTVEKKKTVYKKGNKYKPRVQYART